MAGWEDVTMNDDWYFGSRGRAIGALLMCLLLASIYDRLGTAGGLNFSVPEQLRLKGVLYAWAAGLGALIKPPLATTAVISAMVYSTFIMLGVGTIEASVAFIRVGGLFPQFVYSPLAYIIAVLILTPALLYLFAGIRKPSNSSNQPSSAVGRLAANPYFQVIGIVCSILGIVTILVPDPFNALHRLLTGL